MRREILFKAKRLDNGEWIKGNMIESKNGHVHILVGNSNTLEKTNISLGYWYINSPCYQVNPATVCQFTGLTDKNGKKIFEGDLLHDGEEEHLIGWVENYASFCVDKRGWAFHHYFGESIDPSEVEVISNIHDRKEGEK